VGGCDSSPMHGQRATSRDTKAARPKGGKGREGGGEAISANHTLHGRARDAAARHGRMDCTRRMQSADVTPCGFQTHRKPDSDACPAPAQDIHCYGATI
jgi:hypothetical protein